MELMMHKSTHFPSIEVDKEHLRLSHNPHELYLTISCPRCQNSPTVAQLCSPKDSLICDKTFIHRFRRTSFNINNQPEAHSPNPQMHFGKYKVLLDESFKIPSFKIQFTTQSALTYRDICHTRMHKWPLSMNYTSREGAKTFA